MTYKKQTGCCNNWMELKTSYFAGGHSYYVFQCKNCGKMKEVIDNDLGWKHDRI